MSLVPDPCCSTCEEVTTNIPGAQGYPGSDGEPGADGCSPATITTEMFIMPGCDYPGEMQVEVTVASTGCFCPGQVIYIENAGYFRLISITDTTLLLENLCLDVNAEEGTEIPATSCVSVGGEPGADGSNGTNGADGTDGINAYTVSTASFTQPDEQDTEVLSVDESSWAVVGQVVYLEGGGYYEVTLVAPGALTLKNLEDAATYAYLTNAVVGTVINSGAGVSPAGIQGPNPETQTKKVVAIIYEVANAYPSDSMTFGAWTPLDVNVMSETVAGVCTFTGPNFSLETGTYTLVGHVCFALCKMRIRLRANNANDLLYSVNGVTTGEGILPIFGAIVVNSADDLQFEYYAIDTPGAGNFGEVTGVPDVEEDYRGFMFTKVS